MPESIDLALGEQIGETISPDRPAIRRVESHDLPVAHVVPSIQCDEQSAVCYKKLDGCNRIEQGSCRHQAVRSVLFEAIKFRGGEGPLGSSAKSHSVAKTLTRKDADKIGARVAEGLADTGCGPVVTLRDGQGREGDCQYREPHACFILA